MSLKTQLRLTTSRSGRILIHVICFVNDHKLVWHCKGIGRELRAA